MKLLVASFIVPALAVAAGAATAQPADRASCTGANVASDAMGLRATDDEGTWRYITPEFYTWIEAARFSGMPSLYVRSLDASRLRQRFGGCGDIYARLAAGPLGAAATDGTGVLAAGQSLQLWFGLGTPPPSRFQPQGTNLMALYTTGGRDLLRYRGHLYAVHQGMACALGPPEVMGMGSARRGIAEACSADTRGQLSGVVRRIADSFAEHGVTRVERSDISFENGQLRVLVRVRTVAGRQELQFAEE